MRGFARCVTPRASSSGTSPSSVQEGFRPRGGSKSKMAGNRFGDQAPKPALDLIQDGGQQTSLRDHSPQSPTRSPP